jgi:GNAT superfamily N-acetyltransferase
MKLKPLKPKQHKKAAKIFWVLFPFFGFWLVWRFFKFLLGRHRFYSIKNRRRPKKLLGLAAFTTLIFFKRKWFYLKYFAIAPDSQGQGVGSQTLNKIEAKARRQKHDYFLLLSSPWRTRAHKFYFKKGFKRWLGFIFFKKLQ